MGTKFLKMDLSKYAFTITIVMTILICSCTSDTAPDLILYNGDIYTVDADIPTASAIAIKGEEIVSIGTDEEIKKLAIESTEQLDLKGAFMMPGFIEGHAHFTGLGYSLLNLNFLRSKSWEEIVEMVEEKVKESEPGEWIVGRGWHQEKWDSLPHQHVGGYPTHEQLSEISPDNPVILTHASGHGLFANAKAMNISGVSLETADPKGGAIVRDEDGKAIGVFEERAMSVIRAAHEEYLETLSDDEKEKTWYKAVELAQEECVTKGVTSFQDAGASFVEVDRFEKIAKDGKFDIRLWTMIRRSSAEMKGKLAGIRKINVGNNYYTCRAIKTEVDGALGSYGAWLLESYDDKPDFYGQNTTDIEEVERIAELAAANDMQMCVHAIGDRANREVLNIMERTFKKIDGKDLRWRIEHSQHVNVADIPRFAELNVIASMQGIHCTSDALFAEKRLGERRAKEEAYPWRSLLDVGAVVTNGTDAPVEDVNPLESYYASTTRKRTDNGYAFFPEQKMTRTEALYSYTMANAYAAFEEDIKGSLTVGKLADMVVLNKNLISCSEEELLETEVLYTFVGGELKYKKY